MKTKNKLILVLMTLSILLAGCGISENSNPAADESTQEAKEDAVLKENEAEELSFKDECENNAKEYPAEPGAVLVSKGDLDFTDMKYYFKGKFLGIETPADLKGENLWLVKNKMGYIMPVEISEGEELPEVNSEVEVWGTLTGDSYPISNTDVEETGYMIMMQYSIDGEPII